MYDRKTGATLEKTGHTADTSDELMYGCALLGLCESGKFAGLASYVLHESSEKVLYRMRLLLFVHSLMVCVRWKLMYVCSEACFSRKLD